MSTIENLDDSYTIVLAGTGPGASSRVLKPGDLIGGSYRLKSLLGRGGMGYVFCAEHTIIKHDYALKMLAPERMTEASLRRFEIEAKAIANLDHPNIVKVYNMGLDEGDCPYYVMDLLHGTTLSDCIAARQDIPLEECLDILGHIAAGLGYAHGKGIVHRDMKPLNVIMLPENNGRVGVKIVDFGIAKLLPSANLRNQSQTATGEVFGSPFYMSPEQCMGNQIDRRSDIYSLGCTFFEALCGKPPYCGANAMETVLMHQNNPIPSILERRPEKHWPEAVDVLLSKMMAKKAEARYQSMEQLMHDLERIKQGKAIGKVAPNVAAVHQNPYPAPDRSRGIASAEELPEGNINDLSRSGMLTGNHRAAVFWILGLVLLLGGVAYYVGHSPLLLQQIAAVKRQAVQDPGGVAAVSKASPLQLHTERDLSGASGASGDQVDKGQNDYFAHYSTLAPGHDAGLPQNAGEDDYRQAISTEALMKQLAYPTQDNHFDLPYYKVSDQSLALIAATSWIHDLSLRGCTITNESLARLAKLRLSKINLNNSTFNDVGAARLSLCQGLQDVEACSTDLTDKGIGDLSTIRSLKRLSLAGTTVTYKGLIELEKTKELDTLNLAGAKQITNSCLSALEHIKLHELVLDETSIGDAGISHIAKIASLRTVFLNRTNVTIRGIKELCSGISNNCKPPLKILVKNCPNLSHDKIQDLQAAFPAVQFFD